MDFAIATLQEAAALAMTKSGLTQGQRNTVIALLPVADRP
ncbi:hypothetical protein NIES3974_16220 [Calothrix sp. NIES-3974]|nr:hypothetical protein NIES3974_16220 [Calothrix sp. NIES-3974]